MKFNSDPFYYKEKQIKNNAITEQNNNDAYLKAKVNRTNSRPVGVIAIIVIGSLVLLGLLIWMIVASVNNNNVIFN